MRLHCPSMSHRKSSSWLMLVITWSVTFCRDRTAILSALLASAVNRWSLQDSIDLIACSTVVWSDSPLALARAGVDTSGAICFAIQIAACLARFFSSGLACSSDQPAA